jgi:hypothetical protein
MEGWVEDQEWQAEDMDQTPHKKWITAQVKVTAHLHPKIHMEMIMATSAQQ